MEFITWLIALPTAIVLFFFPVPLPSPQEAQIATSSPVVEVIEIPAEKPQITKKEVISALQEAKIPVKEVPTPIVIPMFTLPVGGTVQTPPAAVQTIPEPVTPIPVATTLSVTRIDQYSKPFGGNCSQLRYKATSNKAVKVSFINPETKETVTQEAGTTFVYYPQHVNEEQTVMFYVEGESDVRVEFKLGVVGTIKDELGIEKLTDAGAYYTSDNGDKISKETGKCL